MKLDDFITTVLLDINSVLDQARDKTGREYHVGVSQNDRVSFDIAVTTDESSGTKAEGAAKAGFVEVLGAKVGTSLEDSESNSQISRIRFTVFFPTYTEAEIRHNSSDLQFHNDEPDNDPFPR